MFVKVNRHVYVKKEGLEASQIMPIGFTNE